MSRRRRRRRRGCEVSILCIQRTRIPSLATLLIHEPAKESFYSLLEIVFEMKKHFFKKATALHIFLRVFLTFVSKMWTFMLYSTPNCGKTELNHNRFTVQNLFEKTACLNGCDL